MKILYISSLIFRKASSASIRNTGLIKGMSENGLEIDVMTIKYPDEKEDRYLYEKLQNKIYYSHLKVLNKYYNYTNKKAENKEIKSKIILRKIMKQVKEIIKKIYFFPDIDKEWIGEYKKLDIEYQKYDLIISSSDTKTSHYIAEKIKRKNKDIKWFQIWGDPWSSDIGLGKISKIRARVAEKKILLKADKIFYVSPFTLIDIKKQYPEFKNKMHYIPRGYLEELKSDFQSNEIVITYTGVLNKNRDISIFLNKIENYNKNINEKKIKLKIYGEIEESIKKQILKYTFVELYESVSFEKIKEIYKKTTILLFLDNGKNTTQIPGKIYDYLGTDRKILCIFKEKNEIYEYFKKNKELLVYQENELKLSEVINSKERQINKEYSNKYIAEKIYQYMKGKDI